MVQRSPWFRTVLSAVLLILLGVGVGHSADSFLPTPESPPEDVSFGGSSERPKLIAAVSSIERFTPVIAHGEVRARPLALAKAAEIPVDKFVEPCSSTPLYLSHCTFLC